MVVEKKECTTDRCRKCARRACPTPPHDLATEYDGRRATAETGAENALGWHARFKHRLATSMNPTVLTKVCALRTPPELAQLQCAVRCLAAQSPRLVPPQRAVRLPAQMKERGTPKTASMPPLCSVTPRQLAHPGGDHRCCWCPRGTSQGVES